MNENDRTTLEQAIYEEMELTPEMIRSIRTLCGVCLCSFVESKAFKSAIVPSADRSMDTCTVCQTRRGHPGYSGAAECPPVRHQAAGYHRPVHLGKPQDRLALQSHPFPGCIPQISGRSGRCPLAHAAQLPPHLCVADAGVGRGYSDHPEHRRPCRHRDD